MPEIDTEELPGWMEEMIQYLEKGELLENTVEAERRKETGSRVLDSR